MSQKIGRDKWKTIAVTLRPTGDEEDLRLSKYPSLHSNFQVGV